MRPLLSVALLALAVLSVVGQTDQQPQPGASNQQPPPSNHQSPPQGGPGPFPFPRLPASFERIIINMTNIMLNLQNTVLDGIVELGQECGCRNLYNPFTVQFRPPPPPSRDPSAGQDPPNPPGVVNTGTSARGGPGAL